MKTPQELAEQLITRLGTRALFLDAHDVAIVKAAFILALDEQRTELALLCASLNFPTSDVRLAMDELRVHRKTLEAGWRSGRDACVRVIRSYK